MDVEVPLGAGPVGAVGAVPVVLPVGIGPKPVPTVLAEGLGRPFELPGSTGVESKLVTPPQLKHASAKIPMAMGVNLNV